MRISLLLVFSIALSGCSTMLRSNQWSSAQAGVPSGNMYYLPATAVHGSVSFIPTSCAIVDGRPVFTYKIIGATVTSSTVADMEQQYYIDYLKLNSATKTSAASFEFYEIGTLKSVNAEIQDRTGETLVAIAGAALNIVKAVTFVPGAPVTATSPDEKLQCARTITRLFSTLAGYRDQLALTNNTTLVSAENIPEAQTVAAPEKLAKNIAALSTGIKSRKTTIPRAGAIKKAALAEPTAEAIQQRLDAILQTITSEARFSFIPTLSRQCSDVALTWESYRHKLFDVAIHSEYEELDSVISTMKSDAAFKASVCVLSDTATRRKELQQLPIPQETARNGMPAPRNAGILYRQPVMASVTIAASKNLPASFSSDGAISVPQYGTLASLDLINGAFDKNSLRASFAPDGALTAFAFNTEATAERGATTVQALSGTYADIAAARDKAAASRMSLKEQQDKKTLNDAAEAYTTRLTLLNAQEALNVKVAGKTQAQLELEDIQRKTTLLQKQVEYENARLALKKLQEVAQ